MSNLIHLSRAVLCCNCETIAERQPDFRCPHCRSEALLDLERLLNRGSHLPRVQMSVDEIAEARAVWDGIFTGDPHLSVAERIGR